MKKRLIFFVVLACLIFSGSVFSADDDVRIVAPPLSEGVYTIKVYREPTDRQDLVDFSQKAMKLANIIRLEGSNESPILRFDPPEHSDETLISISVHSRGCWKLEIPKPLLVRVYELSIFGPNGALIVGGIGKGNRTNIPAMVYWPDGASRRNCPSR